MLKRMFYLSGPLFVLLASVGPASALEVVGMAPPALEPGIRVRITAPDLGMEKQQATVKALRGNTLFVTNDYGPMSLSLSSVTRLDAYAGTRSSWRRGVGVGFGLGALTGTIVGLSFPNSGSNDICYGTMNIICVLGAAAVFGVGGGLIGGVVGAFVKTDRWEEVPLDQLDLSLVPQRDGFALGISVAF